MINLQTICSYNEAKNERYLILTIVFYFSIFNCLFNVMSTVRNCFPPFLLLVSLWVKQKEGNLYDQWPLHIVQREHYKHFC